ncbi:hypothetical protein [Streptomyces sp. NPDC051569]|uniref:hypothetical protein n=1 Tax=Streptomyces sp. NPDC051569 TaxID=3365661 RepID=UPI0037AA3791
MKRRLQQIQYRPDVVDGCLAGAGLSMDPGPAGSGDANARPLTAPGVAASSICWDARTRPEPQADSSVTVAAVIVADAGWVIHGSLPLA